MSLHAHERPCARTIKRPMESALKLFFFVCLVTFTTVSLGALEPLVPPRLGASIGKLLGLVDGFARYCVAGRRGAWD